MESGVNERVTLGILAAKLDHIELLLSELKSTVREDHDELIRLKEQIGDFLALKRIIFGYGVTLIITMALALYSVLQHNIP